ncbi:hypothetical protein [Nostoc sp. DedSLP04]|uniref:hypothetical protein n=1 Tax=Nostoc sp. DedSLP04 TaxID=3075401 RepID=UPI002AD54355|nr:hypothetical protein [Nostoc sp. DedSLP04]
MVRVGISVGEASRREASRREASRREAQRKRDRKETLNREQGTGEKKVRGLLSFFMQSNMSPID